MVDFYDENLRVLNFTHIDFDGVVAGIVIKNYFKNVITEQVNYGKEQEIITKVNKHKGKYDAIIFTDFCPTEAGPGILKNSIEEIAMVAEVPVLVLDHHESAEKYNDPSKNIYINLKYSGCMLAWKYFSARKDLSHLKELVDIANDYDLWILSDKRSQYYNALMWEMGFKWFFRRFLKGNIALREEEKDFIRDYVRIVKDQYDNLPLSELPHKGCFYECDQYLGEMSKRLADEGYQYQIIKHGNALSLRSATDKINLVNVCQFLGKGGGHRRAAGIPLYPSDRIDEVVNNVAQAVEHELNYGNGNLPF
jgi:oligoribonuclease NrnB/cAMP/cGMP phosphodiesterase (DHH superfamily)